MPSFELTYCANMHPAADLDAVVNTVTEFIGPVAAARAKENHAFGMGAWWNAEVAEELAHQGSQRERLLEALAGVPVWTLNIFPQTVFHEGEVRERVYHPDWSSDARLRYTTDAAKALAGITKASGAEVRRAYSMSTLPLGFESSRRPSMDLDRCARNLVAAVSELAAIEAETGVCIVLAVEPEPFCVLERCDQTADFLVQRVFASGSSVVPEAVLRRHLGVCVDLCHLAVMGEDPVAAMNQLHQRGICVPKIQVSSCLEVRDPRTALPQLLAFHEPRYLHQTRGASGRRAMDLKEVASAAKDWQDESSIHTHFHVPVFWDVEGGFGSTRDQVTRTLQALPGLEFVGHPPLLEVETYTYGVLDRGTAGVEGDLTELILSELGFVQQTLG